MRSISFRSILRLQCRVASPQPLCLLVCTSLQKPLTITPYSKQRRPTKPRDLGETRDQSSEKRSLQLGRVLACSIDDRCSRDGSRDGGAPRNRASKEVTKP